MTVKELKDELEKFDDDVEVVTKETKFCGDVANSINSVRKGSYGPFGKGVPCVFLTDEFDPEEDEDV